MALALSNVSRRRKHIRTAMRKKHGAKWRKSRKAVAEFNRKLASAGIYLAKRKVGRKGRKTKRSAGRRKGTWQSLVKRYGVMKAAKMYRGKKARRGGKKARRSTRRSAGRRSTRSGRKLSPRQRYRGFGGKAAQRKQLARLRKTHAYYAKKGKYGPVALRNRGWGALALSNGISLNGFSLKNRGSRRNPFMGLSVMGLASTAVTLGTAAGLLVAARDYATPFLQEQLYSRIPVESVASFATDTAPNLLTGIALGSVAGVGAISSLALKAPGSISKGFFLFAGAAPLVGLFLDWDSLKEWATGTVSGVASDVGALALSNYGALALSNYGALALENGSYGDGFFAETAPVTADIKACGFDQALGADATYCGADFSPAEGQALINGPAEFMQRFGTPTIRQKRADNTASHLAGQPGQRWAWLIKQVGWARAREIAKMPPHKRLKLIEKMRAGALHAFRTEFTRQRMHDEAVMTAAQGFAPEPAAGTVATGAGGASGVSGPGGLDLGAALFSR